MPMSVYADVVTLLPAIDQALASMDIAPEDGALVALVREYGQEIDDGRDLSKIGPALLAAMESLGMSPRARALLKGGKGEPPRNSRLDELRERRARKHEAAALDSATS